MKVFIGIDPGQTGAVVIKAGTEILIYDYEDPLGLLKLRELRNQGFEMYAAIEKVSAMPKQGVTSVFTFGCNFGRWQGRMEALMIPFDLITPQKWQTEMFDYRPVKPLGIKPSAWAKIKKDFSLKRARNMFPEKMRDLSRNKDHNRADALLIMGYCERKHGDNKKLETDFCFL